MLLAARVRKWTSVTNLVLILTQIHSFVCDYDKHICCHILLKPSFLIEQKTDKHK